MELVEGLADRGSYSVHYWVGGKAGAPLVVFTHGATIDHHEWDATLPFVGERYRVLAWDVPGHGLSRPKDFDIQEAVTAQLAILDQLKVDQSYFVGHSLGGNINQEFVFRHPERVKAMAFLGCTWNFQKLTSFESFLVGIAEPMFKLYPYKSLINQSLAMTAKSKESQELLRPAMESHSKEEITQMMMVAINCLHYEARYTIGKPLLLIVGENDRTGNIAKAMPAWAAVEPNGKFVVIPNALHGANLDDPALFHKTLLDFLNEQSAAGSR
jgi:pimeloyl-ACP methyl ester carboxylesterase